MRQSVMVRNAWSTLKLLKERGFDPLKATEPDGGLRIERELSVSLGEESRLFYSIFAGFAAYDFRSQIRLWGLDEIITRNKGIEKPSLKIAIGDSLIDSDEIVADASAPIAEVRLRHEDRFLSKGLFQFIGDIASGKFDFM